MIGCLQHHGAVSHSTDLVAQTHRGRVDLPPVVLLHGSGQDEDALLPFARAAFPGHPLIAVRGRVPWEGGFASFRRLPDRTLDEADLVQGAAAVQRLLGRLHDEGQRRPVLLACGQHDARRHPSDGPSLARQLEAAGASVTLVELPLGHALTAADEEASATWLHGLLGGAATP